MADLIQELGFLSGGSRFRRIYEMMQAGGDKAYVEASLPFKSSWFPVYYALAAAERPLSVMEVTDRIAFSHITVKNIVGELSKAGLVDVRANPDDRRSKLIGLSADGRQLLTDLQPIWQAFALALKDVLTTGHPDIISILQRIDRELVKRPMNTRLKEPPAGIVKVVDYSPELKPQFFELAGHWLSGLLRGQLEKEDEFTLRNPEEAYLKTGGFVFFAVLDGHAVGCVALKRLSATAFEFCKLFTDPRHRNRGIATKLIERCIGRSRENGASALWLQTTMSMPEAHKLYDKLGFADHHPPAYMDVLNRTEKVMMMKL